MSTHMEQAGMDPGRVKAVVDGSRASETLVALAYGGTLRPPYDDLGDVDVPGLGIVDVKSIPSPSANAVNAGQHRPRSRAIVVSRRPPLILGMVERGSWRWGIPNVKGCHNWRPCWHVLRTEVLPPPPWRPVFGMDDPRWYEMTDDDVLHADWKDRDYRRALRRKARPLPLPEIGLDDSRGVGLAMRSGHAPGPDNYRRKRP